MFLFLVCSQHCIQAQRLGCFEYSNSKGNLPFVQPHNATLLSSGKIWVNFYGDGAALLDGFNFIHYHERHSNAAFRLPYTQPNFAFEFKNQSIIVTEGTKGLLLIQNKLSKDIEFDFGMIAANYSSKSICYNNPKDDPAIFYVFDGLKKEIAFKIPDSLLNEEPNLLTHYGFSFTTSTKAVFSNYTKQYVYEVDFSSTKIQIKKKPLVLPSLIKNDITQFSPIGIGYLCASSNAVFFSADGMKWSETYKCGSGNLAGLRSFIETNSTGIFCMEKVGKSDYKIIEFVKKLDGFNAVEIGFFKSTSQPLSVIKDKIGHFWVTTTNSLLKVMPYISVADFEKDDYPSDVWTLALDDNGVAYLPPYADYNGIGIWKEGETIYTDDVPKHYFKSLGNRGRYFLGVNMDSDGSPLIPIESKGILKYKIGKKPEYFPHNYPTFIIHCAKDSLWYLGQGDGKLLVSKSKTPNWDDDSGDWSLVDLKKGSVKGITTDIKRRKIYVAKGKRILAIGMDATESTHVIDSIKVGAPFALELDSKGGLWIGTVNNGLFFVNPSELEKPVPSLSNVGDLGFFKEALSIKNYNDTLLAVSSKNGLAFININKHYTNQQNSIYYWRGVNADFVLGDNPVLGSYQNTLQIDKKGRLFIVGDGKIGRLDVGGWLKAHQNAKPKLVVQSISYDSTGNTIDFFGDLGNFILPSNVNRTLEFHFGLENSSFESYSTIFIQIFKGSKLIKEDTTYLNFYIVGEDVLRGGGQFTLKAKAVSIVGNEGEWASYSFQVEKRSWEYWGPIISWAVAILVVILSLLGLYSWRERRIRDMEKRKITDLTKGMLANVNVHFLKNVIAKSTVLINEFSDGSPIPEKTYRILASLSSNVTYLFDISKENKDYHSLKDELNLCVNMANIYKDLYSKYILSVNLPDPSIVTKFGGVNIPIQLLATYLDNALEHGLHHKERVDYKPTGVAEISIQEDAHHLVFRIADNGVGIKRGKEIVAKNGALYNSGQGLALLEEIIAQKNRINPGNPIEISVSQLDASNIEEPGTVITIKLPKNFNYESTDSRG